MKHLERILRSEMKNIHTEGCIEESHHRYCCNFTGCNTSIYYNDKDLFCFDAGTRLKKY